jgi:hypothetical protein
MTKQDRSEVREMIHDILSGWQAATIAREDVTNEALKNINDHLGRINGSVGRHEQKINDNLPHTIANCAQKTTIEEIRDNMISGKAVRNAIILSIGATGTLFSVLFILYKLLIEKQPV